MEEKDLIQACIRGDKSAQHLLYKKFSSLVYGICLRYAKNKMEAEDSMQEVFVKIYNHLKDYQSAGSFEGWIRRIAVNTAITGYRKNLKGRLEDEIEELVFTGRIDSIRPTATEIGKATRIDDALGRYIEFVKSSVPRALTLEKLRIVADVRSQAI